MLEKHRHCQWRKHTDLRHPESLDVLAAVGFHALFAVVIPVDDSATRDALAAVEGVDLTGDTRVGEGAARNDGGHGEAKASGEDEKKLHLEGCW